MNKKNQLSSSTENNLKPSQNIELPDDYFNNNQAATNKTTTVTNQSEEEKIINIIHFNDVYNVEPRVIEPVGGASRFCALIKKFKDLNPLILFSGDIFNPSAMSTITKGEQMVPIINQINIHYSLYGNHDFDFGMDRLDELVSKTKCKWLMSNALDSTTGETLGGGIVSDIVQWNGVKIGLIGLIEKDWVDCLTTIDPEDVEVLDFVEEASSLAEELKEQGAEYLIALTHMRWPNDEILAAKVPAIQLVLGGHDHDFTFKPMPLNNNFILKSGTDFRHFSLITLTFDKNSKFKSIKVEKKEITMEIEEDEEVKAIVDQYSNLMSKQLDVSLGEIKVDLDGRFSSIRTKETNLGNFITDIMLETTDADFAMLNSGTLRSDMIHPKGDFKVRDLTSILPMVDPMVVLRLSGSDVMKALENSVSRYPSLEGRFSQVSGISFGFDPLKTPGQRVDPRFVTIQGNFIVLNKYYKLVTKAYIAEGKDGYEVFKQAEKLTDPEDGQPLLTAVQNHFESVKIVKGEIKPRFSHRQSIIAVQKRKSISLQKSIDEEKELPEVPMRDPNPHVTHSLEQIQQQQQQLQQLQTNFDGHQKQDNQMVSSVLLILQEKHQLRRQSSILQRSKSNLQRKASISLVEENLSGKALAPQEEGRIFIVNDKNRDQLIEKYLTAPHRLQDFTIKEET